MQELEINCLEKLKSSNALNNFGNHFYNPIENCDNDIILYKRFVDDTLILVKKDKIDNIFKSFNEYNSSIQFTIERETKNSINFLDLNVIREEN